MMFSMFSVFSCRLYQNKQYHNHNNYVFSPIKFKFPQDSSVIKMSTDETQKPEIIHKLNEKIMGFSHYEDLNTAPGAHVGLNPLYLHMRREVYNLHKLHIKARRQKIRELLIQDFLRESEELGEVQFGFINTQP